MSKIDCMLVVEVNLGQLDRVLCSWSSRLNGIILVKWIVWYCLVKLTMLDGGKSFLVK